MRRALLALAIVSASTPIAAAQCGWTDTGGVWGPIIGAIVFQITKELFWTFLLGWQRVALGLLIVLIVVFFPEGIMGFLRQRFPERFGHRVDEALVREEQTP